ncbi:alanine racemase [Anaerobium acetethylicum]|nr:alanine racemase [Anaerobium acetethylicum]
MLKKVSGSRGRIKMKEYRRVCAKIDLDAIEGNMLAIRNNLKDGTKVIAVVKTDAYGHGALPIARLIEPQDFVFGFAVATVEEALSLRRNGIEKPVLILGFTFPEHYEDIVNYGIRPAVFKLDMAKSLSETAVRLGKKVIMHIKMDTGMNRIGIKPCRESFEIVREISSLPNVELEGIFTHFVKADELDKSFSFEQLRKFKEFLGDLEKEGIKFKIRHCSNSAGSIDLQEANIDAVRPGIAMYGLYPSDEVSKEAVKLTPAMTLISHIVYIKNVEKGEGISYGATYRAPADMRVATIPVGYGDGYPRSLSSKGWVLIRGKKAPILGRVCMDQFMVDVSDIDGVSEGDEATLIGVNGNQRISVEEMGNLADRFNYEFVCDLGKRIPRVYLKNGKIVEAIDYFDN